jgi:hypothetical protein
MSKKCFLFLTGFLFVASGLFSFGSQEKKDTPAPERESGEERLARLEKMEKLWLGRDIKSYSARISYTRAAGLRDVITLKVTNNVVTEWSSEPPRAQSSPEFSESLTVVSLLRRLRDSLEAAGNSPMELRAVYDTEYGYIKKLSRVPSGDPRVGKAPPDTGYSIEYLEFFAVQ